MTYKLGAINSADALSRYKDLGGEEIEANQNVVFFPEEQFPKAESLILRNIVTLASNKFMK